MEQIKIPENAYIHGNELSQFIYIQVPMDLVVSECFSHISGNAKILYGLLLNRTGLSVRNGWEDKNGRTYIHYTIEDLMNELGISKAKACRLFSELTNIIKIGIDEEGNDIWFGLIEKVRVLNKPSRIYVHKVDEVKKFIAELSSAEKDNREKTNIEDKLEDDNSVELCETSGHNVQRLEAENPETRINTGGLKNETTVVSKVRPRTSQKRDHGRLKSETTIVSDVRPWSSQICVENNNNKNNNYMSNNYLINPISQNECDAVSEADDGRTDEIIRTEKLIQDNIDYEELISEKITDKDRVDELIELMVEACVFGGNIKIGGRVVPHSVIKSRFENYDMETMEYVLNSLSENTSEVRNVKQYLLTTLYNAPSTMKNHISLMVQHDMNGFHAANDTRGRW